MRVVNAARHVDAKVTFGADKEGRNFLLVVFKATYAIPANDKMPRPCVPPQPVALVDHYVGEPGLSAILYENDLALVKRQCDVVFRAQAHGAGMKSQPSRSLSVVARVGNMTKALRVLGDRVWEKDLMLLRASRPKPFIFMPLHYGHAFGGWHRAEGAEAENIALAQGEAPVTSAVFEANPFGRGYAPHGNVHGLPLPNLEVPGREVRSPQRGVPVALSPLPRTDPTRQRFAGTYDTQWQEEQAPFLPKDFDERFFQCVPEDQRIPFPVGGEEVTLINMMPGRPEVRFRLPRLDTVPVRVLHRDFRVSEPKPCVDTLYFEPDEGRFSVVWRARVLLGQRPTHELRTVVVGEACRQWWEGVRNGGSGCRGCGASHVNTEGHEAKASDTKPFLCDIGARGPAVKSVSLKGVLSEGVQPEHCPHRPDMPAKDPHWPLPEIRIVLEPPVAKEAAAMSDQDAPNGVSTPENAERKA